MSNLIIDLYHGDPVSDSGFHDIKAAGTLAVVHKATEGSTTTDPAYAQRRKRAESVGLLWGAYHFGQQGDGRTQAEHFLETAQPSGRTLVCLDWEAPLRNRPPMTLAQAENFVSTLFDALGRWPVIYSGRSFLIERQVPMSSPLARCPLWVARYNKSLGSVPKPWKGWLFWQNTDVGHEPGVLGPVDVDQFNGSASQLVAGWPF